MTLDLYSFEMLSGRRLTPLPVTKASWKIVTNADNSITCTIPGNDPEVRRLQPWLATTLARNGLLAVVDGVPRAAGPIWKRRLSVNGNIDLTAGGLRSYWDKRILLPVAARGNPLVNAAGDPDTAYDTTVSGVSLGTIAKRYVQMINAWPGGAIPMAFPADEPANRTRTVKAIDLKTVKGLIDNLSNVENGPDIDIVPRWADDVLGIYFDMLYGTEAVPRLGNPDPNLVRWAYGAPLSGAFDLEVEEDGTAHREEVYSSGGAGNDRVVIARSRRATLFNAGFPLLQGVDSGRTDVVEQATMQSYADQATYLGQFSSSFWSMSVRARERGLPVLGDYGLGDLATINIAEEEPAREAIPQEVVAEGYTDATTGQYVPPLVRPGRPATPAMPSILPPGDYVRRIASISGDQDDRAYNLVFAESIG